MTEGDRIAHIRRLAEQSLAILGDLVPPKGLREPLSEIAQRLTWMLETCGNPPGRKPRAVTGCYVSRTEVP